MKEKGLIIYDEPQKSMLKDFYGKFTFKRYLAIPTYALIIVISLYVQFSARYLNRNTLMFDFQLLILFYVAMVLFMLVRYRFWEGELKVYEKGIDLAKKVSFPPKKKYIPFEHIESFYINQYSRWIIVLIKDKPVSYINGNKIWSFTNFTRAIKNKKNIYYNRDPYYDGLRRGVSNNQKIYRWKWIWRSRNLRYIGILSILAFAARIIVLGFEYENYSITRYDILLLKTAYVIFSIKMLDLVYRDAKIRGLWENLWLLLFFLSIIGLFIYYAIIWQDLNKKYVF